MSLFMRAAAPFAAAMIVAGAAGSALALEDPPGFGDSLLLPTGEPFVLPEGLELRVVTYNPFDRENTCKRPDAEEGEEPLPEGGLVTGQVNLCLQFYNSTRQPIDV